MLTPSERLRVGELIDEFELARDQDRQVSPEEICAKDEHLLEAFKVSLERLADVDERLAVMDLAESPRTIGEFEVLEQIGVGGSGVVFRCRQKNPDRDVAVKVLKPTLEPEEQEKRFRREMQVFAAVDDPGLAEIIVSGITLWNGVRCFWFAMQLLPNGRIDRYVERTMPDRRKILQLFCAICKTIRSAHRQGVVHRDIKPSNILMADDDIPRVVDFGVAAIVAPIGSSSITETNAIVGTAAWMAPEVVSGRAVRIDTRADIYGLGVVLFQLISGVHPYGDARMSYTAVSQFLRNRSPQKLTAVLPNSSSDLVAFVGRMMDPDPAYRYQNMDDVTADIERLLNGEPVRARSVSMAETAWRWCRSHLLLSTAAVTVLISLMAATVVYVSSNIRVAAVAEKLREANGLLKEQAKELTKQRNELRFVLDQQRRSNASTRLNGIAAQAEVSPHSAHESLNDPNLFPPEFRGFAWRLLHEMSQSEFQHISSGGSPVWSLQFSRDGTQLATANDIGTLQIVSTKDGSVRKLCEGVTPKTDIRFSANDESVFVAMSEGGIAEIDATDGRTRQHLLPEIQFRPDVFDLAVDGTKIVAVTFNRHIHELYLNEGEHKSKRLPEGEEIRNVWYMSNDQLITAVEKQGMKLTWHSDSLDFAATFDITKPCADFGKLTATDSTTRMADGAAIAGVHKGVIAYVVRLNASIRPVIQRTTLEREKIHDIKLVPPFSALITGTHNSRLRDLYGSKPDRIFHKDGFESISNAVSEDSRQFAVGGKHGDVCIYSIKAPELESSIITPTSSWPNEIQYNSTVCAALLPDENSLAIGYRNGTVVLADIATRQPWHAFQAAREPITALAVSKQQGWLACGTGTFNRKQSGIIVFDLPTEISSPVNRNTSTKRLTEITTVDLPAIRVLQLSFDQKTLFAGLRNGEIAVIDTESWQVRSRWSAHDKGTYGLALNGSEVISGGSDGFIRVWSASSFDLLREWTAHDRRISDVAVSLDGSRIYTSSHDESAAIWSSNGQLIRRMTGHTGAVLSVTVSADDSTLATCGEEQTIRLWDAVTGDEQLTLRGHTDTVLKVRFTPRGLISTSPDRTVRIWGGTE